MSFLKNDRLRVCLYNPDTNPVSDIRTANIFPQATACFFTLLLVFLDDYCILYCVYEIIAYPKVIK